jgi:response regulator RpfG family c-di-GMP phosphodiesterase
MSTIPEILFVDDDAAILDGFQRALRKEFNVDIARGAEEALALCARRPGYSVVVADMQMPVMNGVDFLVCLEQNFPDSIRIMLTGNADQKTARDAVNKGHIFRFLNKPCPKDELISALKAALRYHELITAERELLEKTLNGSIKVLSDVLSLHDPVAFGRGDQLRVYMRGFAQSLKLKESWDLELAALLSSIGYVSIPRSVLEKYRSNGFLSGAEKDMIARVPKVGAELLSHVPRLAPVAQIILYQNKDFAGSGFPSDSVAGEEIPIGSRILRVLQDLLLAESHNQSRDQALEAMMRIKGRYDPKVLEAIAASFDICLVAVDQENIRSVNVKELHVGDVLKAGAYTKDKVPIAPSGSTVTPILLAKLRNFAELGELAEPLLVFDSQVTPGRDPG